MNFSKLEQNICDVIKEEQIKLGYQSENVHEHTGQGVLKQENQRKAKRQKGGNSLTASKKKFPIGIWVIFCPYIRAFRHLPLFCLHSSCSYNCGPGTLSASSPSGRGNAG